MFSQFMMSRRGGGGAPTGGVVSGFAPVKSILEADSDDASILFASDSTGTDTTEWIYRFVEWLASEYPTYSVDYYVANDDFNGYETVEAIQTGTGANTLTVYNAAKAGRTFQSMLGDPQYDVLFRSIPTPDLMVTNLGLNERTFAGNYGAEYASWLAVAFLQTFLDDHADVPFVTVLQNPDRDDTSMDVVIDALELLPNAFPDLHLVDVHSVFVDAGKPSGWYADDTHPSYDGYTQYVDTVAAAWDAAGTAPASGDFTAWLSKTGADTFDLGDNGDFATWGTPPSGWSFANASYAEETTIVYGSRPRSMSFSMSGASAAIATYSVSAASVAGKTVTVAVRHRLSVETTGFRVRLRFNGTGATDANDIDYTSPQQNGADDWLWSFVSADIPADCTSFQVLVSCAVSGETVYVDRVAVYDGDMRPTDLA